MAARRTVDANPNRGHTLRSMSRAAGLSACHFSRLFASAFGVSPSEYVSRARLTAAGRLLDESTLPVWRIAVGCGFESASSFSRAFRRRTGLSPRRWRSRHKSAVEAQSCDVGDET
jgi:transcriptional regulator GlxA family with amidase domain